MANKVQYGIKNAHYAKLSVTTTGAITYSAPVAWPGAVSLSLDAEGESSVFYADDIPYYTAIKNNGYSGDFESALVPQSFLTDIMGETVSTSGVITENANAKPESFAFLFEFEGDASETKYVLYNCKMTRPSIESSTTEDGIEVQTVTGEITAIPRPTDGIVKGVCVSTSATAYSNWYTAVQF